MNLCPFHHGMWNSGTLALVVNCIVFSTVCAEFQSSLWRGGFYTHNLDAVVTPKLDWVILVLSIDTTTIA